MTHAVIVVGTLSLKDDAGQITTIYSNISASTLSPVQRGQYVITFKNQAGNNLASYNFEPSTNSMDSSHGLFALLLPQSERVSQIELSHNGKLLDARTVSNNPPTARVIYPNGGESVSGSALGIRWTATDPDGDLLKYVLQYSFDGGETWQTLVTDWSSPSYEVNLIALRGSNRALIRILASDGFNTAQDQSDATFAISRNRPTAIIQSPRDQSVFAGDQSVVLEGTAYDNEDGALPENALSWNSDLSGSLGTGRVLSVNG